MPMGKVSASAWREFLRKEVTPRFPKGITWWQGSGEWQMRDGQLVRERSYLLLLVHSPSAEDENAVREIVARYKARFQQEAVLRLSQPVAISF